MVITDGAVGLLSYFAKFQRFCINITSCSVGSAVLRIVLKHSVQGKGCWWGHRMTTMCKPYITLLVYDMDSRNMWIWEFMWFSHFYHGNYSLKMIIYKASYLYNFLV